MHKKCDLPETPNSQAFAVSAVGLSVAHSDVARRPGQQIRLVKRLSRRWISDESFQNLAASSRISHAESQMEVPIASHCSLLAPLNLSPEFRSACLLVDCSHGTDPTSCHY